MPFSSITKPFRIDNPDKFRLSDCDPHDSQGLSDDKSEVKAMLADGIARPVGLQDRLYADDRWAPWFVVPADHKWFTRLVVAGALVQQLDALNLDFPKVEGKALKELEEAGNALKEEKS
jgi:hypothetical protein